MFGPPGEVHGKLCQVRKLRRRVLALPEFTYGDLYASATAHVDRTYSLEEARRLVQEATAPLGVAYGKALRTAFADRWVDFMPTTGKKSGAYSTGATVTLCDWPLKVTAYVMGPESWPGCGACLSRCTWGNRMASTSRWSLLAKRNCFPPPRAC